MLNIYNFYGRAIRFSLTHFQLCFLFIDEFRKLLRYPAELLARNEDAKRRQNRCWSQSGHSEGWWIEAGEVDILLLGTWWIKDEVY